MSDAATALNDEAAPDTPDEHSKAEADLDTAMAEMDQLASMPGPFADMGASGSSASADGSGFVWGIPVEMQVVVGRAELSVSDLMKLENGDVVPLDRRLEEPVDVVVNGRLVGRGEITVLDEEPRRFGIKVISLVGQ